MINFMTYKTYHLNDVGNPPHGFSILVSTVDISGNPNPLGAPGVVGGSGVNYPAPATINTTLINDGVIFQSGVYYFTPVVYGNATGTGNVTALTLDPGCTYTGTSVMVTLYAAGDPNCNTGIIENGSNATMNAYFSSDMLQLNIVSNVTEKANVEILDISGKVVYNESLDIYSGTNNHGNDLQGLSTGTNSIRVTGNRINAVVKVVKM